MAENSLQRNIGQFGKVWSPSLNSAYGGFSATYRVDPVLTLVADATLVVSQVSARAKVEAGFAGEKVAVTGSLTGRLQSDDALVEDNSLRHVGARVIFMPIPRIQTSVTGEIPLEGDVLSGARVMGNMNVTF